MMNWEWFGTKQSGLIKVLCWHLLWGGGDSWCSGKDSPFLVFVGLLLVLCSMVWLIMYINLCSLWQPDGWLNFSDWKWFTSILFVSSQVLSATSLSAVQYFPSEWPGFKTRCFQKLLFTMESWFIVPALSEIL